MLPRVDQSELTALYLAVDGNFLDVVRVLLRAGADPNKPVFLQGVEWHTSRTAVLPFSIAVERGYTEMVKAMLDAGADPLTADACGVVSVNVANAQQHAGSIPHYHTARMLVSKAPKRCDSGRVRSIEPEIGTAPPRDFK
jgi:ankyrin repeat protein